MATIPTKNTRKIFVTLLSALLLAFLLIQLFRPTLINPPVTGDIKLPANVKAILHKACYDCHSNQTELSWFDQVVPVYWQVAAHVREGRKGLNFSEWNKLPPPDQKAKLWESVNQILAGAMPLKDYAFVHPSARVTMADITVLKDYLNELAIKQHPDDTARVNALNKQTVRPADAASNPPKALNGVEYIPDYKNWQTLSTTERIDNGTMRIVFGNNIAVKAIKDGHVNPWPNGTIFAKAAWDQLANKNGEIKTGAFRQIEYMIKDDQKYAATKGWGWARFKTPKMIAYGKTAAFTTECISCHQPMSDLDYVFTLPVNKAAIPETFHFSQLQLKVMSSAINKKTATTAILFGNEAARTLVPSGIPLGKNEQAPNKILTLLTWNQRIDPNWFGAIIPGGLQSAEVVKISHGKASYQRYNGQQLTTSADTTQNQARIKYILEKQLSVMP